VFLIYRVTHIPDCAASLAAFREALTELGIPKVHLGGSFPTFPGDDELPDDPASIGLNSYFQFQPRALPKNSLRHVDDPLSEAGFVGHVYDYDDAVDQALASLNEPAIGMRHQSVTMGWDSTPRLGTGGTVYQGATPANFRRWLRGVVQHERSRPGLPERMIFINAWNEWGEGTYLEPDQDFGRGWLDAVASAIGRKSPRSTA
jgi:hypothetical protein